MHSYDEWRRQFAADRLRILYFLGLVANPVFIAADILLYRDHLPALLPLRLVIEIGLLAGLALVVAPEKWRRPNALLILFVWVSNIGIAQMTVVLGGFSAQYANGLSLVFLASAVIVPVSWPSHAVAQVGSLLYYYGANFMQPVTANDINAAIENAFIFIWTCVAILFSVVLYERLQRAEFAARISERRARQEVEASHAKLLELDRLKSEFFANISHELRTPLTLSLGVYRSLQRLVANPECRELIQAGQRNTARLLYLINELLDLARFESGCVEPKKQCIDVAALLRTVAANFESSERPRVHCRGISQPVAILADPGQLKKVIYNLLSNAFKFGDPEKGLAWIRLHTTEDEIVLEVEDNGIGIPAEHLDRIFDRFTQVESSATRRYEGSGIGLALVKEIVTLHGGRVTVTSEVGHGSTFRLNLPRGHARAEDIVTLDDDDAFLAALRPQQETEPGPTAGFLRQDGEGPVVLVADDNADMRGYLERVLRPEFQVLLAKDGAEAFALAKDHGPDLIITDAMMPRMSGSDLLKAVRTDDRLRSVPVIFLTARAGTDARIESLEGGADDYLAKPFDEQELLARAKNLLRARARDRDLIELQKQKLARFLPPQLAALIAAGREDLLKSHRNEITVLFIDLRGFTAFAETAAPEDLLNVLCEYHAEMGHLIFEYGGTLERFAGDAMMVFFNDPLPIERHAEVAVEMGMAMRDRIETLRQQWRKRGIDLGAGIGIATGYATLGMIGFEGRHDYAAIGTVTNMAARLCSEAKQGQIFVAGRCVELIEDVFGMESVGELNLKGFHRPLRTYNVTDAKRPAPGG